MDGETRKYQHLGWRAYWLFFFQNSRWLLLLLASLAAVLIAKRVLIVSEDVLVLFDQASLVLLALFFVITVATLLASWIQYLAYEFSLDEHSIRIKSGILNVEVEAIPYRQIQNVDVERNIFYRLLGVSRLVILTAGTEDKEIGDESEGIIPAIDKHLAYKIQEQLLERANIEKTIEIGTQTPSAPRL